MAGLSNSFNSHSSSFQRIAAVFLSQPGLPFAEVLSSGRIERVFAKHGNLFGCGAIYSTAVMVWSFLGQVLRDGKEAACQAAVARIVTHAQQQETTIPTKDTGDYCRARAKLSEAALRDLTREVAGEVEERADESWLWKGLHAKLIDGFTFTMPEGAKESTRVPTSENSEARRGAADRSSHDDRFVGHGLLSRRGHRTLSGQRNGRVCATAFDPRVIAQRRHRRGGPLLLFVHDDRVDAQSRDARVCEDASPASHGLPSRTSFG